MKGIRMWAKSRGLCVTCGHFPETRKDGDVQVMARGKKSVNARAQLSQTPVERQSKSDRACDCYACPNRTGKGHIEPGENAEGAEENLGLDDIPRVKAVEWILLAASDERIRGRLLMSGGEGGPRALRAIGKACRRKKRKSCKALVAESSVNWIRRDTTANHANFESALFGRICSSRLVCTRIGNKNHVRAI